MLVLKVNDLKATSLEGGVSAQVLCLESEGETAYVVGLLYLDGRSIGMLTTHTGQAFRRWLRLDYIRRYMSKFLGSKFMNLNAINIVEGNATALTIFAEAFLMRDEVEDELLDEDRRRTLSLLEKAIERETTRDPADP